jgi:DnaJ-domain-containing protein 1
LNDYFALLNQPRRPWLDPEEVRAQFIALSAAIHPDRVHNASAETKAAAQARFTALNAACNCLRDPRERLRHLLELERGVKPAQLERLPEEGMELYFELGHLCRSVDDFLRQRPQAASPLLKVQSLETAMAWRERLEGFQGNLNTRRAGLEKEIQALNVAWDNAPESGVERFTGLPLDRLEQLYRHLSYALRWSEQIRERIVQLSFW